MAVSDTRGAFFVSLQLDHERRSHTRHLVQVNDALAGTAALNGEEVTREKLIEHTLIQIGLLLQTPVVEFWEYDWSAKIAMPRVLMVNSAFPHASDVHPGASGLALPKSLVEANERPRRRTRTFVSSFDEQADVDPALFDYYRSLANCEQFVHFPLVEDDCVISAVIAIVDDNSKVDGPTLEFAHLLTNRLMSNLSILERLSSSPPILNGQPVTAGPSPDDDGENLPGKSSLSDDLDVEADAKTIYLDAIELPILQRASFVKKACGDNKPLASSVQQLLAAHRENQSSLLDVDFGKLLVSELTTERAGSEQLVNSGSAGRFQLNEEIGRGGSAVVYHGIQTEPVQREVAIKVLNTRGGSESLIRRFRAEKNTQAMMDHPNIAKIFDAGFVNEQPFLVLELLDPVSITEYCQEHALPLESRLAIFQMVCQGVQHAHQRGVIHRDLKPSNVLVSIIDDCPVPKVIDFGIAKLMVDDQQEPDALQPEHLSGTPAYMSPEQIDTNSSNVDTRSDIYSIGVILYEILTDRLPFLNDSGEPQRGKDLLESIRNGGPKPPSQALANPGDNPSQQAASPILAGQLKEDLDWIVAKCLEKDPSRRYVTVNELAADIRRHLDQEPVVAVPSSRRYRATKFIKRNKRLVLAATMVLTTLIMGIAGTTWGLIETGKQAKIAAIELKAKEAALLAEMQAKEISQKQMELASAAHREAEQTTAFLAGILESPDPTKDGRGVKVADLLDRAVSRLETELHDQPLRRCKLRMHLADTYHSLGIYDRSIRLRTRAVDECRQLFGPKDVLTIKTMSDLGRSHFKALAHDKAVEIREQVCELRCDVQGPDHLDTLGAKHDLVISYASAGRHQESIDVGEEALRLTREKLGPEHVKTIQVMADLASPYDAIGENQKALSIRKAAWEACRAVQGESHPLTLTMMNDLAVSYWNMEQHDKATELAERVIDLRYQLLGPQHPDTLTTLDYVSTRVQRYPDLALPHVKLCPEKTSRWIQIAPNLVLSGDEAKYREFCQWVAEQPVDSPEAADHAAKAILLRPDLAKPAPSTLDKLRQRLEEKNVSEDFLPWLLTSRALLAIRTEDPAAAVALAQRSQSLGVQGYGRAMTWSILALAKYQLGDEESASSALEAAEKLISKSRQTVPHKDIHDLLIAEILHQEATATIGDPTPGS